MAEEAASWARSVSLMERFLRAAGGTDK
jgi:hypothetical protein